MEELQAQSTSSEVPVLPWWRRNSAAMKVTTGLLVLVLIGLVSFGYLTTSGWEWTGVGPSIETTITTRGTEVTQTVKQIGAKTLWDWFQLLFVPVVIGTATYLFQQTEKDAEKQRIALQEKTEEALAAAARHETAFQSYLDRMTELMLKHELSTSEATIEVRVLARTLTLSILPRLDNMRKGAVVWFLYEAGLISKDNPMVPLQGSNLYNADLRGNELGFADLSGARLFEADLRSANLSEANLSSAILTCANLIGANLSGADLSFAQLVKADLRPPDPIIDPLEGTSQSLTDLSNTDLRRADMREAKLNGAVLEGANLSGADLRMADLSGANLSKADLSGARLDFANLSGANLSGANLSGAKFLHAKLFNATVTNEQLRTAMTLYSTTLPNGTTFPGSSPLFISANEAPQQPPIQKENATVG